MSKRMISDVYSVCWKLSPSGAAEPARTIRKARGRLSRLTSSQHNTAYYDPFQTEQVQQQQQQQQNNNNNNNNNNHYQRLEESAPKRQRSLTSVVFKHLAPVVVYGTALALSAYDFFLADLSLMRTERKKQPAMRGFGVDFAPFFDRTPEQESRKQLHDESLRRICLEKTRSMQVAPRLLSSDNNDWGYIDKNDYHVHFFSTGTPPPKPKRHHTLGRH
ncbi:hypothetical protein J3Q64DRAFT_1767117 [Phycomyces blakesleeanus]|uniref:Uncharacterized protein n=2 Tax=Phycomyces blakesleeanus TaxID=4837 RepID=A0A167N607_PHYB8|nr:hypothetical protein PHYBLDRAFT_144439 [Phycomyces blakesleeanus NRRL 1555(-)]OAD75090.1 hypothetical protein PHYBLDRAFT_144439 [Phycomyces blakesleeanus NRRL 1555(-)]|eukprot:XP_018293130.1 hypothetical protein PHYBLDRAFT_144439 [Phycomyces blakesleeanus NRRL 1555(-)]